MEKGLKYENEIKQKVEEMGVYFEQAGHSPMSGRVFAYLLLAEPPYQNFYEIQSFLKASKSAVSNALKNLQTEKVVNYITFSGDRRKYFQVNLDGWMNNAVLRLKGTTVLKAIVAGVLEKRTESKHLYFNEKLEEMTDFLSQLSDTLENFVADWEEKKR